MGVTRLKRKDRKNKARANNRVAKIKQLLSTPVIKNVDREELKSRFNAGENNKDTSGAGAAQTSAPQAAPAPTAQESPATEPAKAPAEEAPAAESPAEAPAAPTAAESPAAGTPDAPASVPAGTPSKEEVFEAQEAESARQAADEADALEPGEVESPGEQFVRNQLADTTTNAQDKDIDAINKVEDNETDITPKS